MKSLVHRGDYRHCFRCERDMEAHGLLPDRVVLSGVRLADDGVVIDVEICEPCAEAIAHDLVNHAGDGVLE